MPTAPLLTPDARRAENHLLDVLQRERITDRPPATDPPVLAPGGLDSRSVLVERAKGALMHHYGIDSHQAFAVLIAWARTSRTPVGTIAHALLRGICEGAPQTEDRQRALVRWLETQLRDSDPEQPTTPGAVRSQPAHQTPRSVERGNGGVQGHDSRRHASLHRATSLTRSTDPRDYA